MLENSYLSNRRNIWALIKALQLKTKIKPQLLQRIVMYYGINDLLREKYMQMIKAKGII